MEAGGMTILWLFRGHGKIVARTKLHFHSHDISVENVFGDE